MTANNEPPSLMLRRAKGLTGEREIKEMSTKLKQSLKSSRPLAQGSIPISPETAEDLKTAIGPARPLSQPATRLPLKLNLGAGRHRVEGWLAIDLVPDFEPDIVENVVDLPSFYPGQVDSILASHILEHVADPMLALLRWFEILKPGGDICVIVPNHAKSVEMWANCEHFPVFGTPPLTGILAVSTGFYSYDDYDQQVRENALKAQAQMHRRSLDLPTLMALMEAAGFECLKQISEREHEAAPKFQELVTWQMCVSGKKPARASALGGYVRLGKKQK
jgi:SAM-dependent methyltransferase